MSKSQKIEGICFFIGILVLAGVFLVLQYQIFLGRLPVSALQGISLGFALLAGAMALGSYWMFRKQFVTFSQEICSCIDDLMEGKEITVNPDQESLTSKVAMKLEKLSQITANSVQRSFGQKQEIQQMVSDISHQLKTPIANIMMYSDTIGEAQLPREQELEFLKVMRQQVKKLEFLVQSLIKMSRLESNMISLKKQDLPIFSTIAMAISSVVPRADRKQIHLEVNCDEKLRLHHDPKWTEEAIFNVLDNAVKYTPEQGRITLTVESWAIYTRIQICDTGIGIDPAHKTDVFKRFYRESKVHQEEGIGVGLYLTRQILSRQGGYVTVQSCPGQGSQFSLFLPNHMREK